MIKELVFSRVLFPLVEVTTGSRFWTRYKEILNGLSRDRVDRLHAQRSKLVHLLKLSGESVDIWQEHYELEGISVADITEKNAEEILSRLPISQKSTFAAGFPDRVTAKDSADRWQYLSSAGTTGRITVVTDFSKRDYLRAAELLNIKLATNQVVGKPTIDIPPSACNVVCGFADEGPEPLLAYIFWCIRNNRLFHEASISDMRGRVERQMLLNRETMLPIDPGPWETMSNQLDRYLDQIVAQKKVVVRALPHFLLWLAKRAQQRQLDMSSVKLILPYGGLVGEVLTERICRAFSARFVNFYGTGEVGAIGGSSGESDLIDIYEELIYLEIVGEDNQPMAAGEAGRIIVTDLTNQAMPIIRYDIGDIGYLEVDEQSGKSRLKLLGRKQECFESAGGYVITSRALQNFFFGFEQIINFKVERVVNDIYKVAIVCLDDSEFEQIDMAKLSESFRQLLGVNVKPKIKQVPFITPETSGKYVVFRDLSGIY